MFLIDHQKIAIATRGKAISYGQLIQDARAFSALIPSEAKRVAIYSENRAEWIFALYGTWYASAAVVPIDFLSTPDDVAYILNDCRAEVIFCSSANRASLIDALAQVEYAPTVCYFDELVLPEVPDEPQELVTPMDATACVVYTSGTTGGPKGVVLTFGNIHSNAEAIGPESGYFLPTRRVMALLPFHHILPLLGTIILPLYVGATIALCPSLRPADLVETLNDNSVDMMIAVPRFYTMLHRGIMSKINASKLATALFQFADKKQSKKLSRILFKKVHAKFGGHLDVMVSGGAPLGKEIVRDFHTLGFNLMEGYGMTESSAIMSFPRLGNMRFGSVGQAVKTNEIRIVDGEVIAKGENIFGHYLNKPEATADALRDGWLYSGDLGYLDDDGHLFITGRKKELLILPNGKKVSPDELENKLYNTAPLLEEVAVFMNEGMLHALLRPVPEFAKLPKEELAEKIKNELIIPFNSSVVPYKKVLKYTIIHDELPKTRMGKTKRFALKELLTNEAQPEYQRAEPQTPEYREIKGFIQQHRSAPVNPDDHLEFDLGMDSLDIVSLLAYLEQTFGVAIDEDALSQYATVRKLAEFTRTMKNKFDTKALDWSTIVKEDTSHIELPHSSLTHILISRFLKALAKGLFKMKAEGMDALPDGPCIFAPNHQSYLDGLFVTMFLKRAQIDRTFYYAKAKHVRSRFVRALAKRCNVVVVDAEHDVKHSIQSLAEVLKRGQNVVIFPEGTRTHDGKLGDFKKTFAILSKELNVPVVPVAIDGAFDALQRGSIWPKFMQKISIRFLPAIAPAESDHDALNQSVRAAIESELS